MEEEEDDDDGAMMMSNEFESPYAGRDDEDDANFPGGRHGDHVGDEYDDEPEEEDDDDDDDEMRPSSDAFDMLRSRTG